MGSAALAGTKEKKAILNSSGFSILEVLVVAALLGFMAVTMASLTSDFYKEAKRSNNSLDRTELQKMITDDLGNSNLCVQIFNGVKLPPLGTKTPYAGTPPAPTPVPGKPITFPSPLNAIVPGKYFGGVPINYVTLENNFAIAGDPSHYGAILHIGVGTVFSGNQADAPGGANAIKDVQIPFIAQVNTATMQIIGCSSSSLCTNLGGTWNPVTSTCSFAPQCITVSNTGGSGSSSTPAFTTAMCPAGYAATGAGCNTATPGTDNYAMLIPVPNTGGPPTGFTCESNDNAFTLWTICCH